MVSHTIFGVNYFLIYLGIVATGLAWLIRFRILSVNGLVFQTQVAYLIPIFGVIFGYFLMDEIITWRVIDLIEYNNNWNLYCKKNNKGKIKLMQNDSLELSFLSIFSLTSFFSFLLIQKFSHKIFNGFFLMNDFTKPQAFHKDNIPRSGGLALYISFFIYFLNNILFSLIYLEYLVLGWSIFNWFF